MKGMNEMVYHMMTVLLEYIDCSLQFPQKCLILLLKFTLHFPIMLALCLMLSMTYYTQNYADIIGGSLLVWQLVALSAFLLNHIKLFGVMTTEIISLMAGVGLPTYFIIRVS